MRDCLAFFGLIFLVLLLGFAVLLLFVSVDFNDLSSPRVLVNGTPLSAEDLQAVETLVSEGVRIEQENPLESQPLPTELPTPVPTFTPVPPLDPAFYRTEVMIRAENFAEPLDAFLEANEALAQDETLLEDPEWREAMRAHVEAVGSTGQALAEVGPPPAEYEAIDAWLNRSGAEAEGLRDNYLRALETGEAEDFSAASENFTRIREYLLQALDEMARAGWPLE
jgi:hypothetical protein